MFRMVLDLQEKNREVSTENSQVPCTHCPLLLTTYIGMGCYLQLVSQFWCIVINWSPRFIQISLVLTVTFFMCSRMPSRRSHYISLSCVLKLLLAVTVSQTSLVSDDFEGFKRYRYLVGCPSLGTWCFSRDWTGFMVLGVEEHYFYPVMARTQTVSMIYDCWVWTWSFGWGGLSVFSTVSLLPFFKDWISPSDSCVFQKPCY